MPPWLDWLDWLKWDCIGAGIIGKILGLWFRGCATIVRKIFGILLPGQREINGQGSHRIPSTVHVHTFLQKTSKIAASTSLTFFAWAVITWKPIWNSAGLTGE